MPNRRERAGGAVVIVARRALAHSDCLGVQRDSTSRRVA